MNPRQSEQLLPQKRRGIVVSRLARKTKRGKPTIAISTGITNYIELYESDLRWLLEEAGPKALEAFRAAP